MSDASKEKIQINLLPKVTFFAQDFLEFVTYTDIKIQDLYTAEDFLTEQYISCWQNYTSKIIHNLL